MAMGMGIRIGMGEKRNLAGGGAAKNFYFAAEK